MTSQNLNIGSQILQKYDYGYGKVDLATGEIDATKNNGQLGRIESFIGTQKQSQQRFDYDSIGRLSESREYLGATNTLTYKQKFDFDRFGNLYRKAANNGSAGQSNPLPMTAIEDADISKSTNRFTTNTTYNEAGMVIADNKFRSMNFSYDANGRQVNATNATNSTNATTVYDALGNRVATKVNDVWQFVIYDAFGKLVAEYGTQAEGNGGVSYVLQDWQGSVRASVNANGFIQARFDFTAFGEEISLGVGMRGIEQGYSGDATSRNGYGLTEKDSSGLNHTWFRKQEQRAGRWTSPDPYKGSMNLGNPQSFNRYSYVENEPTNFVDPSGLLAEGEACDYRGIDPNTGQAIYLGQVINGRCVSGGGAVQVYTDWGSIFGNYTRPGNIFQNQGQDYGGGGVGSENDFPRLTAIQKGINQGKKDKKYKDCVDKAHDAVIKSKDVQTKLERFVSKGARDHGISAGVGEAGQQANDKFNPESKGRGRAFLHMLAQIPAFLADIDRGEEIADLIESKMIPERERCRKEAGF